MTSTLSTGIPMPRTKISGRSHGQFPTWIAILTDPSHEQGVGAGALHCMFFEPHCQWKDTFR